MGGINYRHAGYMSSESKMLTETYLMNYRHGRCMSGEQKTFEIEAGWQRIDMIGTCQVSLKRKNRDKLKLKKN